MSETCREIIIGMALHLSNPSHSLAQSFTEGFLGKLVAKAMSQFRPLHDGADDDNNNKEGKLL